ncbi:MAG: hypothetical protein HY775_01135 [Acidobacteria bacterium]|nr:hypothetical protein [Acidobacteriota bacterium]
MRILTAFSAVVAALAAGAATVAIARLHLRSRRPNTACWVVSLSLFTLASSALAAGSFAGWSGPLFRLYYLTGGVLTVPWMALGAAWLFGPKRIARAGTFLTLALTFFATGVAAAARVRVAGSGPLPEMSTVLAGAGLARALAVVANAGGTPLAIWLLLRAARTLRRKHVMPSRVWGASTVSAGIGVAAVGGVLAALGGVVFLGPALALGGVLMLVGFALWDRKRALRAVSSGEAA